MWLYPMPRIVLSVQMYRAITGTQHLGTKQLQDNLFETFEFPKLSIIREPDDCLIIVSPGE